MFETLDRSWRLIKGSLKLILEHPKLLIFPMFSFGVFSIAFIFILLFGIFSVLGLSLALSTTELKFFIYSIFLIIAFIGPFIATFFAVGLSSEVGELMQNKTPSFKRGFNHAYKNIKEIFLWSLTILAVKIIEGLLRGAAKKYGGGGMTTKIGDGLISILMAGWSFAISFVVPIIAFEDTNPFHSIKKSVQLLKNTWGETLVGAIGAGTVIGWLAMIPIVFLALVSFLNPLMFILTIPIIIIILIFSSILTQVFNTVFMTVLYLYATKQDTKAADKYFESDLIKHGFY